MKILPGLNYEYKDQTESTEAHTVLLIGDSTHEAGINAEFYIVHISKDAWNGKRLRHAAALLLIQLASAMIDAPVWVTPLRTFREKLKEC